MLDISHIMSPTFQGKTRKHPQSSFQHRTYILPMSYQARLGFQSGILYGDIALLESSLEDPALQGLQGRSSWHPWILMEGAAVLSCGKPLWLDTTLSMFLKSGSLVLLAISSNRTFFFCLDY